MCSPRMAFGTVPSATYKTPPADLASCLTSIHASAERETARQCSAEGDDLAVDCHIDPIRHSRKSIHATLAQALRFRNAIRGVQQKNREEQHSSRTGRLERNREKRHQNERNPGVSE